MGNVRFMYLDDDEETRVFTCKRCNAHLFVEPAIVSSYFSAGVDGPAWLVSACVNVDAGPPARREMLTGTYETSDISCTFCHQRFGWVYLSVPDSANVVKLGKYVFIRNRIS